MSKPTGTERIRSLRLYSLSASLTSFPPVDLDFALFIINWIYLCNLHILSFLFRERQIIRYFAYNQADLRAKQFCYLLKRCFPYALGMKYFTCLQQCHAVRLLVVRVYQ